jgi:hypothetical protein
MPKLRWYLGNARPDLAARRLHRYAGKMSHRVEGTIGAGPCGITRTVDEVPMVAS